MKSKTFYRYSLMALDGFVLYVIFFVLSILRSDVEFVTEYWYRAFLPIFLTWMVLDSVGAYDSSVDMQSLSYTSKHIVAIPIIIVLTILFIYLFSYKPSLQFSRSVLPLTYITFLIISLLYRRILNMQLAKRRRTKFFAVIGVNEQAQELFRAYQESSVEQSLRFFDITEVEVGQPIAGPDSPKIEGNALHILRTYHENCDGIIVTTSRESLDDEITTTLVRLHFKGIPLIPVRTFFEQNFRKIPLFILNNWWLIEDDLLLVRVPAFHRIKQAVDFFLSALLAVCTLPLFLVIAVMIRLESKGPAFFKQIRVGKNEMPFTMFKFRTMYTDVVSDDKYARQDDKRITRVGRFLRKSRMDELPQLWNVLYGNMSLIGPRAEWIDVSREYQEKIPYYHFRHMVKPGITGWAQVNYKYGENLGDTIEKLQYDLYYISHYSLLLEVDIFLKTLYVIVFGRGQ